MNYPAKMNVLWLVDHLGNDGILHGAGMYYLNIIPRLDPDRFQIHLCVLRKRDELTGRFEERHITVHHLGRNKLDPLTFFDVKRIVNQANIDLIHAHGYGSSNFARLVGAICGTPAIIHAHDDDKNYPWYQKTADSLLSRYTDKAIAVSESVKAACVAKRKVDADKVVVLHNGIQLDKFVPPAPEQVREVREQWQIDPAERVVGVIGRLREEKGTRYFVEAAVDVLQKYPQTRFFIAGDGPLRQELEALARELGVAAQVTFAGFCQDIPAILALLDVVVVPSLTEGSPLAVLEAMAMGKPIVATSVGGTKEILENGKTGLLVPAGDHKALAKQILLLLQDESQKSYLGRNAFQVSRHYGLDTHLKTIEQIYLTTQPLKSTPVFQ